MDPEQVAWLEKELKDSNEDWKIPYFHHPPYSSGDRHGSDARLREVLEPLFLKYNVSVVLHRARSLLRADQAAEGHRLLRVRIRRAAAQGKHRQGLGLTAAGYDTDQSFLAAEINGDEMSFNAVSRTGKVVDSGVITRRK